MLFISFSSGPFFFFDDGNWIFREIHCILGLSVSNFLVSLSGIFLVFARLEKTVCLSGIFLVFARLEKTVSLSGIFLVFARLEKTVSLLGIFYLCNVREDCSSVRDFFWSLQSKRRLFLHVHEM